MPKSLYFVSSMVMSSSSTALTASIVAMVLRRLNDDEQEGVVRVEIHGHESVLVGAVRLVLQVRHGKPLAVLAVPAGLPAS